MERGALRVYVGAAPGVGKTYAMLGEVRRRRERGADVVVGLVETHGRAATAAQLVGLEVIPRRNVEYRGTTLSELDVDAVIARRPAVVAIDEFAHTNAPGSRNEKRWQDVEEILDAGIDVITTVNVQHLESLNDVIAEITGVTQTETIPDRVVRSADQIELIDMSPEALRRRMAHGNVYPPDRADAALANFFRAGNLGALRELALLWVADRVEEHLGEYRAQHGLTETWETRERVVVGITGAPGSDSVVRRAARIAQRVGGELVGVHVAAGDGRIDVQSDALTRQFMLLESLGGTRRDVVGDDPVATLVDVARHEQATQIVIGVTRQSVWDQVTRGSFAARLSRAARDIDVHIVGRAGDGQAPAPGPHAGVATVRRRRWWALAVLVVGLAVLSTALHVFGDRIDLSTVLLLYLALVIAVATIGGRVIALAGALLAALVANFLFVEPRHTLTIADPDNVVALVVFVVVGLVIGVLVDRVALRSGQARRARAEAAVLARTAAVLAADPDPVERLLSVVTETLGLAGARLVETSTDGGFDRQRHETVAAIGDDARLEHAFDIGEGLRGERRTLLVGGRGLTADDQRILTALGSQLGVAIDRRGMGRDLRQVEQLAAVDQARTALLRAVSHDLRTPLATIKALSSGLCDPTVRWDSDQLLEMHHTIDLEADRLNRLISNLLDAGRLESGSVGVTLVPVSIADVVDAAVSSVASHVDLIVDVRDRVPSVLADRSLLERSVANLVDNAQRHAPPGTPVAVTAARIGDEIHLCVIDRGPGIPEHRRRTVLEPFQRFDDTGSAGVGLGLAIVDGFVRAMNGRLVLDDTPGGGLTATISLPIPGTSDRSPPANPDRLAGVEST